MTAPLSVNDLFTPAPSGIGPYGNVPVQGTEPSGSWFGVMLGIGGQVGLPTTAFESGTPERTILAIQACTFAEADVNVSIMAQGGFLQSAATGTVTYTTLDGTSVTVAVTPDPSNAAQNPTAALGWLDLLSTNVYDVTRLSATLATGPLAVVNLGSGSVGPYAIGAYHVGNTFTGATYTNPAALTIPPSKIAGSGGTVSGVTTGLSSTILSTASAHGLATGQTVYLAIPLSSGISGLAGVFAIVTGVTTSTFSVSLGSSGTWTGGGQVYLCTVATMQADVAGPVSNAAPGAVTTTVTQNTNVFASNVVAWAGNNWESNVALMNRCVLSLANRSPNGPSQAYVYFAETAAQLLAAQTPAYVLTNGSVAAAAFGVPSTGTVTVVVASSSPVSTTLNASVTPGCAQLKITGVSNSNPCVVTCAAATSLQPGQSMTVTITTTGTSSLGVAGVLGTFLATYVGPSSFSVPVNTVGAGSYTGGGQVEGGDLGQIDALIQQNVTPDNTTAITQSALALPILVTATVVVPQAYATAYALAASTMLAAQISSYPLGGFGSSNPPNSVPWDDILAALEEAGEITIGGTSYVRAVQSLNVNGFTQSGQGVPFPSYRYQAIMVTPVITVLGV